MKLGKEQPENYRIAAIKKRDEQDELSLQIKSKK